MKSTSRKRIFLIFIIIFQQFFLTGCWDRIELNDLSIIMAAAFDKTKDNKFMVSAEVFVSTEASGGTLGGGSSGGTQGSFIQSAIGENMADAISKLQEKLPRKIFWGHNKAFIFGESLAKQGIQGELDYLTREIGIRERTFVFVSRGKAKNMIAVNPPMERNEAEVLRKMAESRVVMGVTILDLWKMIQGDARAAAVPMIRLASSNVDKKNNQAIAFIDKVAIFKKDRMVGEVDDETARGIQWLKNDVKTPIITIHPKGSKGFVSMKMLQAQTKLEPYIENGKLKMLVKGETRDDIVQNATQLDVMNPSITKELEKELSKQITQRMDQALEQVQKGMKADVFRFGDAFHRKYPREWNKISKNWDNAFSNVEVQMDIDAHILSPGLSTKPAGVPEKEVKEK